LIYSGVHEIHFILILTYIAYAYNMQTIYKKTGVKIRSIRKKKGFTQEELAGLIDMDPRSIIDIEMGNRNPTLQTLYRLCKALKVKSSDLLSF